MNEKLETHTVNLFNRSAPLKVALVAPPYFEVPPVAYGGVEAMLADLADGLVDLGHHVTVLGAGRPGTRARFRAVWDSTVHDLLGAAEPEVMYAASSRRAVAELAAAGEVDLVHDHTYAGPLNAPYYASLGLPTALTVHGPVGGAQHAYYELLGADVSLISISERQRVLAPDLNWAGTVYNGVRVQDWPYEPDSGDYALFLGRFSHDKGAHVALDAAHAAGLPVVLAGKCSEATEKEYFAREVAPRMGPADRFVGVADARLKRELLTRARCLLFPVLWEEPFGMVMIEAMVCGTPVVAMRAGAVPEVIEAGVTGLICDDIAELPAALRKVDAIDPAACRRRVCDHFSAERMAAGYAQVYRDILTRTRSSVPTTTLVPLAPVTPLVPAWQPQPVAARRDRARRPIWTPTSSPATGPTTTVSTPGRGR